MIASRGWVANGRICFTGDKYFDRQFVPYVPFCHRFYRSLQEFHDGISSVGVAAGLHARKGLILSAGRGGSRVEYTIVTRALS